MGRKPKAEVIGLKPEILALINKQNKLEQVEWVQTRIHALNLMIGNGIPRARIIECFGTESGGKTSLGWEVARAFQEHGWLVCKSDVEGSDDLSLPEMYGVNTEIIPIFYPKTVEQFREELVEFVTDIRKIDKKTPILWLLDSVANLSGEGEWEKGDPDSLTPKANVGAKAKSFSEFFRQFTLFLKENNVTLFCINQVREKIGIFFGNNEESTGGRALKFGASVRIRINRGAKIVLKEKEIGYNANFFIEKNKVGIPHRGVKIPVTYGKGFEEYGGLLELLEAEGRIVDEGGGKFNYNGKLYNNEEIPKAIIEHPELLKEFPNVIKSANNGVSGRDQTGSAEEGIKS